MPGRVSDGEEEEELVIVGKTKNKAEAFTSVIHSNSFAMMATVAKNFF